MSNLPHISAYDRRALHMGADPATIYQGEDLATYTKQREAEKPMSIKDEMMMTGHYSDVKTHTAYHVNRSRVICPITQGQFKSWLRSMEQQFFFHSMA